MAKGKFHKWLEPEGLALLEGWARDGLSDEQIAHNMGVSTRTLYIWKKAHLQIFQAMGRGKEVVDYDVENSLLKRALGYEYQEEKLVDGEIITITKRVQPDVTAQMFWLRNRRPNKWRDKPEPPPYNSLCNSSKSQHITIRFQTFQHNSNRAGGHEIPSERHALCILQAFGYAYADILTGYEGPCVQTHPPAAANLPSLTGFMVNLRFAMCCSHPRRCNLSLPRGSFFCNWLWL